MRYFVFLFVLLASNVAQSSTEQDKDDAVVCDFEGVVAELVMYSRQEGENLSEQIKESPSSKSLILRAYERPRFMTEENKKVAIRDFANEVILDCYKRRENDRG